jgi:hypothetical protein
VPHEERVLRHGHQRVPDRRIQRLPLDLIAVGVVVKGLDGLP